MSGKYATLATSGAAAGTVEGDAPLAVDVVVNNYNYARFLQEAIDSALAQTHPNVRVIVVDDGSQDRSRQVIGRYRDRVVAVFKENGGQALALNAGLLESRGDVVLFLDSDDRLRADAAARIAEAFAADPTLSRVHGRMEVVDSDGRRTGTLKPESHLPMPCGDIRGETLRNAFDLAWLPTSANAFSASVLRQICPMPEADYKAGADSFLVHVSSLFGPIGVVDAVIAEYRVHGANVYEQSTMSIDTPHVRESIRLAETTRAHLREWAGKLGLDPEPATLGSFSEVANRAVWLRFDGSRHPIPGDTRAGLLKRGYRAASRRTDVSRVMRFLLVTWLAAFLASPRPIARWLGEVFLFPQRRTQINRALGRFHRSGAIEEPAGIHDPRGASL